MSKGSGDKVSLWVGGAEPGPGPTPGCMSSPLALANSQLSKAERSREPLLRPPPPLHARARGGGGAGGGLQTTDWPLGLKGEEAPLQ